MVECTEDLQQSCESQETVATPPATRLVNVEILRGEVYKLEEQLKYTAFTLYCEASSSKGVCDCVNSRVHQLVNEIYPSNCRVVKQIQEKNKKSKKPDTSHFTANQKFDEISKGLVSDNDASRRKVESAERDLAAILKFLVE